MRYDLIKQRPDIVKAWLNAELDAQLYFVDPKNAMEIVKMAREQTTGFSEKALWMAAYGTYPKEGGGTPTRIILPYVFTPEATELIKRASAFLFEIKSINSPTLRPDAVMPDFAQAVLKERGLTRAARRDPPAARVRVHGAEVGAFRIIDANVRSPHETSDAQCVRGNARGGCRRGVSRGRRRGRRGRQARRRLPAVRHDSRIRPSSSARSACGRSICRPGSEVEFQNALQGSIIVNQMLANKQQIGYLGDMPAVVATTKRSVAPINLVANTGMSAGQRCNVIMVRADAPKFASPEEAVKWLDGKTVATPQGSCAHRFLGSSSRRRRSSRRPS
jgi:hypothetical protein